MGGPVPFSSDPDPVRPHVRVGLRRCGRCASRSGSGSTGESPLLCPLVPGCGPRAPRGPLLVQRVRPPAPLVLPARRARRGAPGRRGGLGRDGRVRRRDDRALAAAPADRVRARVLPLGLPRSAPCASCPRAGLQLAGEPVPHARAGAARAHRRRRPRGGAARARPARASPDGRYQLVGFVDEDDQRSAGCAHRRKPDPRAASPICRALIRRHRVTTVLLAIPRLGAARDPRDPRALRQLAGALQDRARLLAHLEERLSGGDARTTCRPRTCCRATPIAFDERRSGALVARAPRARHGRRRAPSAARSRRQLAQTASRQLVMVDMNENELYLRARRARRRSTRRSTSAPRSRTSASRRGCCGSASATARRTSSTRPRTSTCR